MGRSGWRKRKKGWMQRNMRVEAGEEEGIGRERKWWRQGMKRVEAERNKRMNQSCQNLELGGKINNSAFVKEFVYGIVDHMMSTNG